MKKTFLITLASLFATTLCLPQIAHAQEVKFLMRYGDIMVPDGLPGFENYMELLSYELTADRAVEMVTGEMSNRSRNLPQYQAIDFRVALTGFLFGALQTEAIRGLGQLATIVGVVVEDGTPTQFLEITLQNCILNYLTTTGTEGSMGLMEGGITFTDIEFESMDPDPKGSGTLRVGFDLTTGVAD